MYVCLTFDDGTMNQYRVSKLLSKFNIKCTIFIITHLEKHPYSNKELIAAWPEKLRELHSMGHEIGSHSCTHPDLSSISPDEISRELSKSKRKLENIINERIFGFAYPYGSYNENTLQEIKKWYFYAKGTTLFSEDPLNIKTCDRYKISSVGIKKMVSLPLRIINHLADINKLTLVITIHDIPPIITLILVFCLKIFLRAQFVTMHEMVKNNFNLLNKA